MATSKAEREARKERKSEMSQLAGRLAKVANQRLRSLEQAGVQNASNAYRYIERLHFDKDSATSTDSKGHMKFNTNFRGMSYQQIQHEVAEITRFLEAKTSTPARVKEKYERGYQTFISNNIEGSKLSFQDYADIMRNATIKKSKEMFGSSLMLRIAQHMKDSSETLEQVSERIEKFDPDKNDMQDVEEMLSKKMPWQKSQDENESENENVTEQGDIT